MILLFGTKQMIMRPDFVYGRPPSPIYVRLPRHVAFVSFDTRDALNISDRWRRQKGHAISAAILQLLFMNDKNLGVRERS